jgi:hypothetical protein
MGRSVLFRYLGRVGIVSVALVVMSLIGVQYARVIGRNVALANDVRAVQNDVVALRVHRAQQRRELSRLTDPHGAVPEIHDRLHLVGDDEAIIYLKRNRMSVPQPQRGTDL